MRDAFIKHGIYHLEGSEINVNKRTIMFIQYRAKRVTMLATRAMVSYQVLKAKTSPSTPLYSLT